MKIYHLTHRDQWEKSGDAAVYRPQSLSSEGFIHCSTGQQLLVSANRFYAGSEDLLIVVIDPDKVGTRVEIEDLHGSGVASPHIYGPLPLLAVEAVIPLMPNEDGSFSSLPPGIELCDPG
jgi:uncharacterized protein (DUF952 family)